MVRRGGAQDSCGGSPGAGAGRQWNLEMKWATQRRISLRALQRNLPEITWGLGLSTQHAAGCSLL